MPRWSRRVAVGALSVSVIAFGWVVPATASVSRVAQLPPPVVRTDHGAVRGAVTNGVERFVGIPYAAAPKGALRWKAPRPRAAWRGVRDATHFGRACPALASSNGPRSEAEDCLVINVWRPAGTTASARLPVHAFIHGGGLLNGNGAQNDESKLVRDTGVVGVSFNYRLGVFGFLRTPALAAENRDAGNYGFLDQQAALRWVQRNIAAFGGRADRVTIDGESAGGWSVCGHLVSPGSRGLFSAAMIQSGSCSSSPPARAMQRGNAIAKAVGCPTSGRRGAACLRAVRVGRLLDASGGFAARPPRFVSGTPSFPTAPATAVGAGRFERVPLVVGVNRDEGRTFALDSIGANRAGYEKFVRDTFRARAAQVFARYPWPATSSRFTAAYLIGAIDTDSGIIAGIGGCATRRLTDTFARFTRTYAYEFDHRTGPGLTPIPGYVWGAGHAAELAYIWPSFNNGTPIAARFNTDERRLANEMTKYWGAFTKNGRPAVDGQERWPRYDDNGRTLSLRAGGDSTLIDNDTYDAQHQCTFWTSMPRIDITT